MSDIDARKAAPALLDRAERMLATYQRRGTTNVAGTFSLIRDLAAVLRNRGELEAIVRDLAAAGATFMQVRERAKAWVSAHPVSGDQR